MLTWSDHYANDQLKAVAKATGLQGRPTLFSDNADAYLKIKQTGGQFDIVSGDTLWVPKYHKDGLTESFDLSSMPVSKQLYSIAWSFPFWKDGSNCMAYPLLVDRPHLLQPEVRQGEARLVARAPGQEVRGKISLENIPTDMVASPDGRRGRRGRTP